MICDPCRDQRHPSCEDIDPASVVTEGNRLVEWTLSKDYASCFCLHKVNVVAEPATGPAGE